MLATQALSLDPLLLDGLVAAGSVLCAGMLGWMLRREEQLVTLDAEGMRCGPRLLPWADVHGLGYTRGSFGALFRVSTRHGVVSFRDEQLDSHPDNVSQRIVREAGLVPAPVGSLAGELPAGPGDTLAEWATPEAAAAARESIEQEQAEADEEAAEDTRLKGAGIGLAALLALLFKFGKLVPAALKLLNLGQILPTAASMGITVWAYAQFWGADFALGFVALILVHELGHAAVMQRKGLRTSPIVFVPFVGALIAVKDQFRDAMVESETAYGGPAAGALAATACYVGWRLTGQEYLLHMAYVGFLLNLFNLLPITPLDGGRIVTAVSPLLWIIGLLGAAALAFTSGHPVLVLIVILGALRAWKTWRADDEHLPPGYYDVTPGQRALMAVAYFGLAGYLGVMTAAVLGLGAAAV